MFSSLIHYFKHDAVENRERNQSSQPTKEEDLSQKSEEEGYDFGLQTEESKKGEGAWHSEAQTR